MPVLIPAKQFGARSRSLRLEHCWSILELGNRASLHPRYIEEIERGQYYATPTVVVRIAKAFGLTVAELLGGPLA